MKKRKITAIILASLMGISAVPEQLHFAGTMTGDVERVLSVWRENLKPLV